MERESWRERETEGNVHENNRRSALKKRKSFWLRQLAHSNVEALS